MNTEIDFHLETKIEVGVRGDIKEIDLLVLKAPTSKHRTHAAKLKQLVMRAIDEANRSVTDEQREAVMESAKDKESEDEDIEDSGKQLMGVLNFANTVDMAVVHEVFAEFIKKEGVCYVDGDSEVKMTSPIYDKLQFEDVERLIGVYLASFLM